jgi:hypothetical protein
LLRGDVVVPPELRVVPEFPLSNVRVGLESVFWRTSMLPRLPELESKLPPPRCVVLRVETLLPLRDKPVPVETERELLTSVLRVFALLTVRSEDAAELTSLLRVFCPACVLALVCFTFLFPVFGCEITIPLDSGACPRRLLFTPDMECLGP